MYAFCCIWKTYFQKGTSGLLSQLPRVSVIFTSRVSKVEWEGTEGSMEKRRTGGARALQRRLLWFTYFIQAPRETVIRICGAVIMKNQKVLQRKKK